MAEWMNEWMISDCLLSPESHRELSLVLPWPCLSLSFLQLCADLSLFGHSQLLWPLSWITPQLLIQPVRGQIRKLQDLKWGVWGPMNSIPKGPQDQVARLLLPSSADPCTTSFCYLCSHSLSVPWTMFLGHLWLQIPCRPLMTSCLANSQSAFRFYLTGHFLQKALFDSQISFTLPWCSDPPLWWWLLCS